MSFLGYNPNHTQSGTLGKRIVGYRCSVGLAQKELAVPLNIDPSTPRRWEKAEALGVTLPVRNIEQAERLLQEGVITPKKFIEQDETVHAVMGFQPEPVGYSGFDNCVIHSLAQTNLGLFEVGRYPAMDLESQTKAWQWFIHRKIKQPKDQLGQT